jgi:hypothetical protein
MEYFSSAEAAEMPTTSNRIPSRIKHRRIRKAIA